MCPNTNIIRDLSLTIWLGNMYAEMPSIAVAPSCAILVISYRKLRINMVVRILEEESEIFLNIKQGLVNEKPDISTFTC